ncbi:hypothetical protein LLCC_1631 [Lactococcus cremoris]|uniref:Uncharacterized protein n=1 Tax=Lactococcus lactis subsp. cremoris TaxID=1359 RepID=A0AAD1NH00_LACLC|nr:hypothetical protein SK110_2200 [Lactococcus cremoris]BBC76007.1 hypothetical protein LLCC_1631 [Lactococcus cremoris]BCO02125.1 hypothetical protein LLG32_02190 [Lactococcus cremoris]BCO05213.1 hypothetical protein LLC_04530 [Lactococcus cremoris]
MKWAEKEQLENVLLLKNKTLIEKRKSFDLRFFVLINSFKNQLMDRRIHEKEKFWSKFF